MKQQVPAEELQRGLREIRKVVTLQDRVPVETSSPLSEDAPCRTLLAGEETSAPGCKASDNRLTLVGG